MGFKCGIVGLPNVGKSTLFNALTQTAAAQAANYPFCTIEPNVGDVAVPDRAARQAGRDRQVGRDRARPASPSSTSPGWCAAPPRAKGWATSSSPTSAKWTPSSMCCAASRTTTSPMSKGRIDPVSDAETVETELMLADLESLEKRIKPLEKKAQSGEKEAKEQLALMMKAARPAARGQAGAAGGAVARGARALSPARPADRRSRCSMSAMSTKPRRRRATNIPRRVEAMAKRQGAGAVVDLGAHRGGSRAACRPPSARNSSPASASKSPASTG